MLSAREGKKERKQSKEAEPTALPLPKACACPNETIRFCPDPGETHPGIKKKREICDEMIKS